MTEEPRFSYAPDPDHPGWVRWKLSDEGRYNESVLGPMIARVEGDGSGAGEGADVGGAGAGRRCRVRIVPQRHLTNIAGNIHGGATLGLVDCSLFCAMMLLRGIDARGSVTIALDTQFIGAGNASRPLDAVVEVLRETRRMAFLRGLIEQGDTLVAAFSATLRKPTAVAAA